MTYTGKNRRTGVGLSTSFGAMTGDNIATGVGSAAIKDTLLLAAVAGNLRCATCDAGEYDREHHPKSRKTDHLLTERQK